MFPNARNAGSAVGAGNALAVVVATVLKHFWGWELDPACVGALGVIFAIPAGHFAYLPPEAAAAGAGDKGGAPPK